MKWIMDNITTNNAPPKIRDPHEEFIELISKTKLKSVLVMKYKIMEKAICIANSLKK